MNENASHLKRPSDRNPPRRGGPRPRPPPPPLPLAFEEAFSSNGFPRWFWRPQTKKVFGVDAAFFCQSRFRRGKFFVFFLFFSFFFFSLRKKNGKKNFENFLSSFCSSQKRRRRRLLKTKTETKREVLGGVSCREEAQRRGGSSSPEDRFGARSSFGARRRPSETRFFFFAFLSFLSFFVFARSFSRVVFVRSLLFWRR